MTAKQIEAKQAEEAKKLALQYDTARQIRELLDGARRTYGAEEWDGDDIENHVLDLVVNEE